MAVWWLAWATILGAAPADDYLALTSGLVSVPGSGGTPGTVVLHGRLAFPVFTANTNGTSPVVGAGVWADSPAAGRGVALAHTGWTSSTGDMGRFLSNAVHWAARGKAGAVVAKGAGVSTTFLNSLGYVVKSVDTSLATPATDLSGVDVFLMNGQSDYTAAAVARIAAFAAAGGGVLVFSTPWAASSGALADANEVLGGFGLTFSGSYNSGGPFVVAAQPFPEYVSALPGLDLLQAHRSSTTNLMLSVQQAAAEAIDGVLAVRPMFGPLTNGLQVLLDSYGGVIRVNAGRTLTKASAPIEALCERYHAAVLDRTAAAAIRAHPDAEDWPGPVDAGAPVMNRTVMIPGDAPPDDPALINQGSHGTREPIGLYARAGTVVRVTIPEDLTGAGLRVQIGHHHDENFHLDAWHRHPKVARYEPLTNVVNEVASPYGGLILVRVPPGARLGRFPITVSGAVEAPHFVQGVSQPADWARLRSLPGAQGYIRSSNFTAYVSRRVLQSVPDPVVVAEHWGRVISTSDHFMGYLVRYREEAAKTDRDIIAGGGHAGYPVVMAYGDDDELVRGVLGNGDWGYYHELGHTYQDNGHGWNGTSGGEVDVNLVPNLLMTLVHGRSLWDNNTHGTMDASSRATARAAFFTKPPAERLWSDISGGNTAAYDFYFNLVEGFGYDLWRRAFSRFYRWSTNAASEPAFAGLDRYNRWLVAMSEESGYNLGPYFANYGWPIDPTVAARFVGMPEWTENRSPTGLHLGPSLHLGEDTPAGTLVAEFSVTDPDPGNRFIYSIVSGNEDGAFQLDRWTGELRVAGLDHEGSAARVLTVTVFDNALPRFFLTNTLQITVGNVPEPPAVRVPLLRAFANSGPGVVIGSLSAVPDTGRSIVSFTKTGGSPYFGIDAATGEVRVASAIPPFNGGIFQIEVRVTDDLGNHRDVSVPVLLNTPPGLREQRWNGSAMVGAPAVEARLTNWPAASIGDNYVRRLTAWLVPPASGWHTFWVTGSDRATFSLGTNSSPTSLRERSSGASTGVGNFDADPAQRSAAVWLVGGRLHALEVVQTEGTGSDYAQVAWEGPSTAGRELIPAAVMIPGDDFFLPPWEGTAGLNALSLRVGRTDAGGEVSGAVPFLVELAGLVDGDPAGVTNVQCFSNGQLLFTDDAPPFVRSWTFTTAGHHVVQMVGRDRLGRVVASPVRVISLVGNVTSQAVVPTNAVWRYFDRGQDLGTSWRESQYDDASWSEGPARLGFGYGNEATVVNGGPSSARYPTTYFRRRVTLPDMTGVTGFNLGVSRDDGAVVYVNGKEVFRTGMNAGSVGYGTLAVNATDGLAYYSTNLAPALFVEGDNLVAVEVHQSSATSSDLGFALRLERMAGTPGLSAAIVDPAPGALVILPGGPVLGGWRIDARASASSGVVTSLTARVNGVEEPTAPGGFPDPLTPVWFYRPPGPYILDVVARASSGQSVTSAPVSVTVIANEAPTASILFPSPFSTVLPTNTVFLQVAAGDPDGRVTSVELFLDNQSLGILHGPPYLWLWQPVPGSHHVSARVRDETGGVGLAHPVWFQVSAPPLVTNFVLIATNAVWDYRDDGVDLGSGWFTNAPLRGWSKGAARLGFGGDGESTVLRGQPVTTYYFRHGFSVPTGFTATNLLLRVTRDDGVLVYFRGQEIVRDNLPAGLVTATTRALTSVGGAAETQWFEVPLDPTTLGAGGTISAEVHQVDGTSSDIGFGLELTAKGYYVPPPITLRIESLATNLVNVWFPAPAGEGYVVEASTNLVTWEVLGTHVSDGSGAWQFPQDPTVQPWRFYRVRRAP